MKQIVARIGIGLFVLGIAAPVSTEWVGPLAQPPMSEYLLVVAPICWIAGLICGILGWRHLSGKIATIANGAMLALIVVVWMLWIIAPPRWGGLAPAFESAARPVRSPLQGYL